MAGGREGVDRTTEILSEQVARTMHLLGVSPSRSSPRRTSPSSPGWAPSRPWRLTRPETGTGRRGRPVVTHLLGGSERATLTRRGPPYAVEQISAELAVQIGISAHAGTV